MLDVVHTSGWPGAEIEHDVAFLEVHHVVAAPADESRVVALAARDDTPKIVTVFWLCRISIYYAARCCAMPR